MTGSEIVVPSRLHSALAVTVWLWTLVFGMALSARAQTVSLEPPAELTRRLGPLYWSPTVALDQFGIDTNVFNEIDDPKRDFTASLSPQSPYWFRLGRGRVQGTAQITYLHFQKHSQERALNTRNQLRVELPLNRVSPFVGSTATSARERPGFEIDARVRRLEHTLTLGADVRLGANSSVGLAAWRTDVQFDGEEVFLGASLRDTLNRQMDGIRLSLRRRLTPLTTFAIEAEAQRDRFAFLSARNADSVRAIAGFDFSPFTLITGTGRVGFRKYDPLASNSPAFRGVVASADLGYTLLGVTRFAVHVERDIAYSYDIVQPYYLQTGATGTITQRITPRWDLQLTGARYQLDYQELIGASFAGGPTERIRIAGGGVGYRLGTGTRLAARGVSGRC